jgi:hypothetical protein
MPPSAITCGDRGGHRHRDAKDRTGGVPGPAAEPDQHAGRAGAHEVQGRGVRRAAADDDRHVELVDELLEVERLGSPGHVLGGHRGAADHEQVDARVDHRLVVLHRALRGKACGHGDPGVADLLDAAADQLFLDRLGVDLLQAAGRRFVVKRRELREQRLRIFVPRPQPLEVEYGEPAEPADRDRRRRADDAVHRGDHQRHLEPIGVDLPGHADLFRVAGAAGRHDADLVQRVRAPA